MNSLLSILILTTSILADSAHYKSGEALYFEKGCNGCHGLKAEGMSGYPSLANRAKGFLAYKLERFRSGISENQQQDMMIPFAQPLSDKDIDVLTTYLNEFYDPQTESYDSSYQTWGDGGS